MLRAALLVTAAGALRPAPRTSTKKLDVLVVGGGISGLATALELARRGRSVKVVSRDLAKSATLAAGGMLAPQAERLAEGPLLDLCVQAREAWPAWLATLDAPRPTLNAVGGFVSPSLTPGSSVEAWRPPGSAGPSEWLDGAALKAMEPALGDVRGGWWYPLETWVDPVQTHACLLETCKSAGVEILVDQDVAGLDLNRDGACTALRMEDGSLLEADDYCVAAGAWLRGLLPIPVAAQKGQMLSLSAPPSGDRSGAPSRVVYGEDCYIIPRGDRVVVGATVEDSNTLHCDVQGVHALLGRAQKLCPGLGSWQLDDAWAGLRPTTVDGAPVLGRTRWTNLWVCGGYWRNGILLAPTAARLLADAMDATLSEEDAALLDSCRWDRFFAPVSSDSSRLREGHAGLVDAEPADLDRIGYDAIKNAPPEAGQDARAANLAALFGAAPAAPAEAPTLGEGGYEAVRGVDGAASRKSNLELLFGEKALDLPTDEVREFAPEGEGAGFPRAAPGEDVILSAREVLPDGSYGPDLVTGALPSELAGPTTKADNIQGLVDLPSPKVPLSGASAADDLYAAVARNKGK